MKHIRIFLLIFLTNCTRIIYLPATEKLYPLPQEGNKDIQGTPFPWMGTEAPDEVLRIPLYDKDGKLQWMYIPVSTNPVVLTVRPL